MHADESEHDKADVWALVALPPPFTGMTLLTQKIIERLNDEGPIHCYDWSPKNVPKGRRFRMLRAGRVVRSMAGLLFAGRARGGRLYVASNYRAGLWLTLVLVVLGRCLGYRVFLHHHTYTYIDHFDRRMKWIDSWLGRQGVHVVACPQMEHDFRRVYPAATRFAHVSPSLVAGPIAAPRTTAREPFRLGHLGNLSLAKGLDLVIDTFEELHGEDDSVRLELAGPCHSRAARRLIDRAVAKYPTKVRWIGAVSGNVKWDFYHQIDCFLFPTRSEAWGIVLTEAMGSGVPAIASDRGCVRTVVGPHAGLVIRECDGFARCAADQIRRWRSRPDEYQAASAAAREQAIRLQQEAEQMLEDFVATLFDKPVPPPLLPRTSMAQAN